MKIGKNILVAVVLVIGVLAVSSFYFSYYSRNQSNYTGNAVTDNAQAASTSSSSTTSGNVKTIMAIISHNAGYYFTGDAATDPTTITVSKGDVVKIITQDENPSHNHGITIDEYGINQVTSSNPTIQFTADKVGTFKIYCKPCLDGPLGAHPWMTGTLVVNS